MRICLASGRTPNSLRALMHRRISSHVHPSNCSPFLRVTIWWSDEMKEVVGCEFVGNAVQSFCPVRLKASIYRRVPLLVYSVHFLLPT
jgi:hypothetical protein